MGVQARARTADPHRRGPSRCTRHEKVSPAVRQVHPGAVDELANTYKVEFLGLASDHSEPGLHGALLRSLGRAYVPIR